MEALNPPIWRSIYSVSYIKYTVSLYHPAWCIMYPAWCTVSSFDVSFIQSWCIMYPSRCIMYPAWCTVSSFDVSSIQSRCIMYPAWCILYPTLMYSVSGFDVSCIQLDVTRTQLDVSCIQLYVSCIQLHVSSIQLYAHLVLEAPASRTCRPEPKRTTRSPAGHVTEYSMVLTGMPHCIMATIHISISLLIINLSSLSGIF